MPRIYETYEPKNTATETIYRLGRLFRHRAGLFFKRNSVDITPEQWGLLLKLAEKDGQTQSELADPNLNDHPNITRMVDGLEKKWLAVRTSNPDDRRSAAVYLTDAGRDLIDRTLPDLIEEKSKYYEGLTEKDMARLMDILRVIERNILKEYT